MKQLLLALTLIIAVASLAAVGTYAAFVDTETSEGNTMQAGSLDLILENPQDVGESWDQSVLRTWHYESLSTLMEPGDILASEVYLKAFGTSQADHVDIVCVNVDSEPDWDTDAENEAEDAILGWDVPPDPNNGIYNKSSVMIITYMKYHTTTIITSEYVFNPVFFTDTSGDGRISLDEFAAQGLHGLTPAPDSGTITFSMTVKFADDAGNEYQGDATDMTLIFTLTQ